MGLQLDTKQLEAGLEDFAKVLETFGRTAPTNPMVKWRAGYNVRQLRAWQSRPSVGRSGTVRGNPWHRLKPQYKRKTDGVTVPVWGGVPRLRTGTVTRAGVASERFGEGAGRAVVKVGQKTRTGPVLGKLKRTGRRYKEGDPQLGKIRKGGLLGSWLQAPPVFRNKNRTVEVRSRKPHAVHVERRRRYVWGPKIQAEESKAFLAAVNEFVLRAMRALERR
jgi:hypothetical protein